MAEYTDESGRIRFARPTVYAGTKMRSRTEAKYAQWLGLRVLGWQRFDCRSWVA